MDHVHDITSGVPLEPDRLERPLPPLPLSEEILILPETQSGSISTPQVTSQTVQSELLNISGPLQGQMESGGLAPSGSQNFVSRNRSSSSVNPSTPRTRPGSRPESLLQPHAISSNDDLYVADDSRRLSRTSSIHGGGAARSLRINSNGEHISRSRSHSRTLVQELPIPSHQTPRSDSVEPYSHTPLISQNASIETRRRQRRESEPELEPTRPAFIVPRWQPDAEVTMCPICRTQFSFFVRKHHCRKCGRVVCNACSPHRITIPHQYIVQPPTESPIISVVARPLMDPQRTNSSNYVDDLGGGERVRLCNPCVPDPNTAPPQIPVPYFHSSLHHHSHSRSASTSTTSYSARENPHPQDEIERLISNFSRRPQDSGGMLNSRPLVSTSTGRRITSDREDQTLRPDIADSRSRSSTVGSARDSRSINQFLATNHPANGQNQPRAGPQQPYTTLIPRMEPTNLPSRPRRVERRQIPEEDECWVCHLELPSRTLPNFGTLREAHVEACLASAMQGSSPARSLNTTQAPARTLSLLPTTDTTSTLPPSTSISTSTPILPTQASSSSSFSSAVIPPIPVPNTPEARMAARERAHAAVVFASLHPSSPGNVRRTGVFPYQATEKDCVDDAECTICLEEFVIGVEMGRLECFCRFHLGCIRQWFEGHPGQCPVHQHGAGY